MSLSKPSFVFLHAFFHVSGNLAQFVKRTKLERWNDSGVRVVWEGRWQRGRRRARGVQMWWCWRGWNENLIGGMLSDLMGKRFEMRGRLWSWWTMQTLEGVFCILLGVMSSLGPSISIFVQASYSTEGDVEAVVIDPADFPDDEAYARALRMPESGNRPLDCGQWRYSRT
ncbi:hypothetical protein Droror1_Dr00025377 [Drosera rotundifolia]